jgi:penicillin-insensitive murein endopeptidase
MRTSKRLAMRGLALLAAACSLLHLSDPRPAGAAELAKDLFGAQSLPSAVQPRSYGFYSKGCFDGGLGLPLDGPTWQVMRPSRNRNWGHPTMIALLEKLSRDAVQDGWNGLLVGDISQPRGGPMLTGHASHQIGLDADIWFSPMPPQRYSLSERETVSAVSMLKPKSLYVDDKRWTASRTRLLKRAASYPEVERIFVHPGIKKKLCDTVTGDRSWLNKVRPFWGHDAHFHIRIGCQPGSPDCKGQESTGRGDGCDKSLDWWFTDEPWRPAKNPDAPKARDVMTMAALPKQCRAVLSQPSPPTLEAALYKGGRAPVAVAAAPEPSEPAPEPKLAQKAVPVLAGATGLPAFNAFAETPVSGVPLPRPRPSVQP